MSLRVGYPYEEWQEHDIYIQDHEDECGDWWNRLTKTDKFKFFPWATGSYGNEKVQFEEEYEIDFWDLNQNIIEQIVEKYAVQKGLVVPEDNLPNWKTKPFYDEKIKEILLK